MRFGCNDDDSWNLCFHTSKVLEFFFSHFYKHWSLKVICVTMFCVFIIACVPCQNPPDWQEILTYFRGSELQNYFTKILEDDLRAIVKPQYVDQIPKTVKVSFERVWLIKLGVSAEVALVWRWVVIVYVCPQGSVGAILSRKDDTDTQDLVCQQLGKHIGFQTSTRTLVEFLNHTFV